METNPQTEESADVAVTVRLRPEQIQQLDELASKTYRRRSDLIRMAVDALTRDKAAGVFPPEADPDLAHRNPVVAPDEQPARRANGREAA
ncbi:MAG TPA: ribbon-helix-helix domain-containing protein [Bacteroidia bacterium]|nr:ribbon-helix-helix domain-containing protein [Bacteroidia bacterium]